MICEWSLKKAQIEKISDLSNVTQSEISEECGVTAEPYDNALDVWKKRSLYYINENHAKPT